MTGCYAERVRRKPSQAPRRLLSSLLLAGLLVGASCRLNYEEQALALAGSSSGGNGTPNGGSSSTQAGESQAAGAPDGPLAGSSSGGGASGGATGGAGSSALGDAGAPPIAGAGGADPNTAIECADQAACSCASLAGHGYWFCTSTLTWSDAQAACETQGMHLVRIDSQLENDFLVSTGGPFGVFALNGFAQIGANDLALAGEWRWVDGTLFWQGGPTGAAVDGLFSNWLASSPSSSGVQQCSGILSSGKWQVRSCTAVVPFICEGP